ncbi:MAG: HAD family hydrolase [bacterium]|nr:HAD family hydrolase [bacterium]
MLRAILFDLDDTLIDWGHFFDQWEIVEGQRLRGVYDYISESVFPLGGLETYTQEYFKRTRDAWQSARDTLKAPHLGRILCETAIAMGVPADRVEQQAYLTAYKWDAVPGTKVFPDVVEALTKLRERGLRFGIVTNAFQPMILRDTELQTHGLLDFFPQCRFSAADVGYLKPHPDIFATALACLGTTPEETVFVGDNPIADIAGAQGAGMRAILRRKKQTQGYRSLLVVPDAVVDSLLEIPAILDKWYGKA